MKINTAKQKIRELLSSAGITLNGDKPYDIQVYNEDFYPRIILEGGMGLGESYMDGWWDAEKVYDFIGRILRANLNHKVRTDFKLLPLYLKTKLLNLQTRSGSKKIVQHHYDLDNELFESFLDPYMQYTCAYFEGTDELNTAQRQKMELICQKLQLSPEDHVLEMGCGWGGLARYMAEHYGCRVTGLNISREQVNFAKEFCRGLPVNILEQDYRDASGKYDKIVIVGMMEHVGNKNYRNLMKIARRCLKDDGLFLIHTIGCDQSVTHSEPWTMKYIFPDSHVPSVRQFSTAAEGLFVLEDWHNMGINYYHTLVAWLENFENAWPRLKTRYDDRFFRMWKYYLAASAGSFKARKSQLWQVVLSKEGVPGGYSSIRRVGRPAKAGSSTRRMPVA